MGYRPSPRPSFDRPTAIHRADAVHHTWGDEEAGFVEDWIYVSSQLIHAIVFGLPSGGAFRHSDSFRTVFAADELLHVLQGTLVLANPETGEVVRAEPGESVFFRRDTWHHGFSYGDEPLRVLELFAPPPATGTSGAYARTRPVSRGEPLCVRRGHRTPPRCASGDGLFAGAAPPRCRVAARSRRARRTARQHRAPDGRHAHRGRGTDEPGGEPRRRGARLRHPRCATRRGGRGRGDALTRRCVRRPGRDAPSLRGGRRRRRGRVRRRAALHPSRPDVSRLRWPGVVRRATGSPSEGVARRAGAVGRRRVATRAASLGTVVPRRSGSVAVRVLHERRTRIRRRSCPTPGPAFRTSRRTRAPLPPRWRRRRTRARRSRAQREGRTSMSVVLPWFTSSRVGGSGKASEPERRQARGEEQEGRRRRPRRRRSPPASPRPRRPGSRSPRRPRRGPASVGASKYSPPVSLGDLLQRLPVGSDRDRLRLPERVRDR